MEIRADRGNVKLDFTEAEITQATLHIEVGPGAGGDLILVIKPAGPGDGAITRPGVSDAKWQRKPRSGRRLVIE